MGTIIIFDKYFQSVFKMVAFDNQDAVTDKTYDVSV